MTSTTGRTICIQTPHAQKILGSLLQEVERTPSGLVLPCGSLSSSAREIADALSQRVSANWIVACVAGVSTDSMEITQHPAMAAMTFPRPLQCLVTRRADAHFGERLRETLKGTHASGALALVRSDERDDGWLAGVGKVTDVSPLIGGGTLPGLDLHLCTPAGVQSGAAVAAVFSRGHQLRTTTSSACRLLAPLRTVTRARSEVLEEIEGVTALERLREATQDLLDQPLVVLAVATGHSPLAKAGRALAVLPIAGIDPSRGSVMLSDELPPHSRVAFAVRDAAVGRDDLRAHVRSLHQHCAGGAPEFGVYVNCAGRGEGLYGAPRVDERIIRQTFPGVPFLGFHGTFQFSSEAGYLGPRLYAGVLGMFCRPS